MNFAVPIFAPGTIWKHVVSDIDAVIVRLQLYHILQAPYVRFKLGEYVHEMEVDTFLELYKVAP
jgi:predicted nucleotidyltransferase